MSRGFRLGAILAQSNVPDTATPLRMWRRMSEFKLRMPGWISLMAASLSAPYLLAA